MEHLRVSTVPQSGRHLSPLASGGGIITGIDRVFFSSGKHHDVLKKKTRDKTLEIALKTDQGGGIHTEEEFNPWIRVCCLFSPGK